ncbi:TPA: tRNA uridine-5-carboxymethylaminomethyl(34) synthesis enzyme MnmG [Candidatus Dependentiae bacterium]|nr:MAG: tRNA uridine 5-carboxymethylaminomethyl modification enzyme MnmG [candidate division TM6 bacterium GW2011_GWE2_31_21]KKP53148.1 MAG: tRNA uridine 5-carboxymethylaminomethyl modification enzyme MnmG [candidate division TM6 bacterium GW2011_GWF2_33_332]HBS47967.1 tRNA uridine-5-carboxymethylaminomethyl(34) synthesis enzyme MnmG [Candidatus Dependentiae bacterium]HBZ73429.1 tRNA uridine-5-carboxymethylaminomethyl(34) synthesis enzyme MnmG [Candidatus Dependentiae bacterium]
MLEKYDVIIVGGGHAGCEAAYVAANLGSKTLLVTIKKDRIAWCPCNPSIGGLGKGHIVYEIAAFNGLMPKLCSKSHLQARMLNTSKGPAVQGLRVQVDKFKYSKLAQEILSQTKNLEIFQGEVASLLFEKLENKNKVIGIKVASGEEFFAKSVVVTVGTFLNGTVHIGLKNHSSGREGEPAATFLTGSLQEILGIKLGRLKTGTPPRLLKSSLDYSKFDQHESHQLDFLYEFDGVQSEEKVSCFVTATNESTHEIIRSNFARSARFGGAITGIGPRYCPSIEDKVARFPDRKTHHVFVEPEGLESDEVYPAGLSTSLPLDVQIDYIRSIKGFENAEIARAGYAIEYDFLPPTNLKHSLEAKNVENLFFAGQINGTTGYEEAAGQGLVAAINAHLKVNNKDPFILNRNESYIGVMIDDLVTIGIDEPYRMFTSRAERRLLLRQDNTFLRLMPHARDLGLISDEMYEQFLREKNIIQKSVELIKSVNRNDELYKSFFVIEFTDEIKQRAKELLAEKLLQNNLEYQYLLNSRVLLNIHAEIKYEGYLQREVREVEKASRYQSLHIPQNFDYKDLPGLCVELQQKLTKFKPANIAQAQLIPGMTPAAISLLIFQIRICEKIKTNLFY